MCIPKEIVGKARTIVVFPRKVGLDVSHVVCGVMCRLGEQLSMTDGSTMQTSFHCDIADKKAYQCTECAADYVGSPVGGGLLPLAPVSHNPRVDVVSSTLTTLPPTINVIKKKCGDRSHTRQGNKQNSYSKQADTQVPQSNGTNNKQLRQEEDAHGSTATHFFHASPNQNNNCNSFIPPCPPLHLFLRLPTRYREANGAGRFWTRRSDRMPC